MEVRVTLQLTEGQCQAIVLTQVAITAATGGVLEQKSLVMLLRDDIDNTRYSIRAVKSTRRTLHDLDLLDVLGIDEREVVLTTHITMNALAVDQYQDIVVAKAVELHLGAHVILAESERGGQACEDVLEAATTVVTEHLARDDLGLNGRILQQVLCTSTRHHHFLQAV